MRRIFPALIFFSLLLTVAACSKTEQANSNQASNNSTIAAPSSSASPATGTKTPPPDIVTASATEVSLTPGKEGVAIVQINITDGYHINGNPASKYQIATTLEVEPSDGITAGPAQYPPSITKKFSFSPDPIAVYESKASIKVSLKAAGGATKGPRTLRAKMRVQPCDDQVCYPPRNIETTLPVTVK